VAAASVLTAVAFGVLYFINVNRVQSVKPIAKVKQENVSPVLKMIRNRTKYVQDITLADGSIVKLEANSELRYYDPYESDKRGFYLSGEAYFKVAKDSSKPFTVYSNEISTTALGTAFRIIAFENKNLITVKLYEGKVVIQAAATIKKLEKNYFLKPGDEFTYDRIRNATKVARYVKPLSGSESKIKRADDDSNETNWFMFNNQKLSQVLDQLSAIYNVKIEYSAAELNKMNFIGKIEKSDSIEQILNDIALLNNLTVKKTIKGYSIRRK
jgi:ferric-dicitrate binding protein FerR (iron transport regulator)